MSETNAMAAYRKNCRKMWSVLVTGSSCYKIVNSQNSFMLWGIGVAYFGRSESVKEFWIGRTYYLRLRHPGRQPASLYQSLANIKHTKLLLSTRFLINHCSLFPCAVGQTL